MSKTLCQPLAYAKKSDVGRVVADTLFHGLIPRVLIHAVQYRHDVVIVYSVAVQGEGLQLIQMCGEFEATATFWIRPSPLENREDSNVMIILGLRSASSRILSCN